MAIINTGLLTKGLRSEFFQRFESVPAYWQDLSTRVASDSNVEIYRWLGTVPRMREWGEGRVARGMLGESYSIQNLKYEATLEVDRDELADDQTGQIRVRIGELAQRAATHRDYLLAQLLTLGDQDGYLGYDGVNFFNTNHLSGASGPQSNVLETAAADPLQPTTEEFRSSLRQAIAQVLGLRDDQGHPMSLSAEGLWCVVPPAMYFTALEAVTASLVSSTSNVLAGAARVIAFPWLTADDRWYLLKNDGVVRPFIFQDREPITFTALAEDSEEAFRREKFLYGVRARYRMAYGYWQFAVQTTFTVD